MGNQGIGAGILTLDPFRGYQRLYAPWHSLAIAYNRHEDITLERVTDLFSFNPEINLQFVFNAPKGWPFVQGEMKKYIFAAPIKKGIYVFCEIIAATTEEAKLALWDITGKEWTRQAHIQSIDEDLSSYNVSY